MLHAGNAFVEDVGVFLNASLSHTSLTTGTFDVLDVQFALSEDIPQPAKGAPPEELFAVVELDPLVYGEQNSLSEYFGVRSGEEVSVLMKAVSASGEATQLAALRAVASFGALDPDSARRFQAPLRFIVYPEQALSAAYTYKLAIPMILNAKPASTRERVRLCIKTIAGAEHRQRTLVEQSFVSAPVLNRSAPIPVSKQINCSLNATDNAVQSQNMSLQLRLSQFDSQISTKDSILLLIDATRQGLLSADEYAKINFSDWVSEYYPSFASVRISPAHAISASPTAELDIVAQAALHSQLYQSEFRLRHVQINRFADAYDSINTSSIDAVQVRQWDTFAVTGGVNATILNENLTEGGVLTINKNVGSTVFVLLQFYSLSYPATGYMRVKLSESVFNVTQADYSNSTDSCLLSGNFTARDARSAVQCFVAAPNELVISGYGDIANHTLLQVMVLARIDHAAENITLVQHLAVYASPWPQEDRLIMAEQDINASNAVSTTSSDAPRAFFYHSNQSLFFVYANESRAFQFNASLSEQDIPFSAHQNYLQLKFSDADTQGQLTPGYALPPPDAQPLLAAPLYRTDYALNTSQSQYEYQISAATDVLFSENAINIYPHHSGQYPFPKQTHSALVSIDTQLYDAFNGVRRPEFPGLYRLQLRAFRDGDAAPKEIAQVDYLVEPRPDRNFNLTALARGQGLETVLKIDYTPVRSMRKHDEVWLEFMLKDGAAALFQEDLGLSFGVNDTAAPLDCTEGVSFDPVSKVYDGRLFQGVLTGNQTQRLACYLHRGNATTNTPALIRIPVQADAVAVNQSFQLFIATIVNPAAASVRAAVRLTLRRPCRNDGYMCPYAQSTSYYQVAKLEAPLSYSILSKFGKYHNDRVSCTGTVASVDQTHTHYLYYEADVEPEDYVAIMYPCGNHRLQERCYTTNNEFCVVFPKKCMVLYRPNSKVIDSQINPGDTPVLRTVQLRGMA